MDKKRTIVYETEHFYVEVGLTTLVSREDGGHLQIKMKQPVTDRTELSPKLAIEYTRLSMIVGKALKDAMNHRGIPVVTVNYQEMGNWAWKSSPVQPKMHMHIFGRALNAKKQIFPEAVQLPPKESGFYEDNEPLNDEDIAEIQKQIEFQCGQAKYQPDEWGL